jgi:hypothetical protein
MGEVRELELDWGSFQEAVLYRLGRGGTLRWGRQTFHVESTLLTLLTLVTLLALLALLTVD